MNNIFEEWEVSAIQLTNIIKENPSLRGMILGYIAEYKLRDIITSFPEISFVKKFDDHNRRKKGDLYIVYHKTAFNVESKSLQTNTVKFDEENKCWQGKTQVDASDRRIITLPNGEKLNTTLLLRGEFDVLAVNCYAFKNKWQFIFARNRDLPCSKFKKYSEEARQSLISSLIPVTWPPKPPFYTDLKELLEEMIQEGEGTNHKQLNE